MMLGVWSSTLKIFNKALTSFSQAKPIRVSLFLFLKLEIITFDLTLASTYQVLEARSVDRNIENGGYW